MTTHTPGVCAAGLRITPLVLEPVRHAHWPRQLLTPGQHAIGADPAREICVPVQGMAPRHALLTVDDSGVWIEAEDRRTWVNDGPVRRCRLKLHDRLTVGPCSWIVLPATSDDILGGWPSSPVTPSTRDHHTRQEHTPVVAGIDTSSDPNIADEAGDQSVNPLSELDRASDLLENIDQAEASPVPQQTREPSADRSAVDRSAMVSPPTRLTVELPVANPGTPEVASPNKLIKLHDELQDLRRELDHARSVWRAETHRREVELATESTALARRGAAIERSEHELDRQRQHLEGQLQQLNTRESAQSRLADELERMQSELLSERQKLELIATSARKELADESARRNAEWSEWEQSQERLLADLAQRTTALNVQQAFHQTEREELERRRTELAAESLRRNAEWNEWEQSQERLLADLAQRTTALNEQQELHQTEREELARRRTELDARCQEFAESQRAFEAERDRWVREHDLWKGRCRAQELVHAEALAQIERQQSQLTTEVRERSRQQGEYLAAQQQLQAERRQFHELQQAWIQERETAWQELNERRRRLDAETDSLEQSRHAVELLQVNLERECSDLRLQLEHSQSLAEHAPLFAEQDPVPATAEESPTDNSLAEQTVSEEELTSAEDASTIEEDPLSSEASADFEAVQEALDALASRFEEFSELEQRIAQKRAELREQQQQHADRHNELDAELSRFEQEQAEWRQFQSEDEARRQAWEVARQAELLAQKTERERWAAHFAELQRWFDSPPAATSMEPVAADSEVDPIEVDPRLEGGERELLDLPESEPLASIEVEAPPTPELNDSTELVSSETPSVEATAELDASAETAPLDEFDSTSEMESTLVSEDDRALATLAPWNEFDSSTNSPANESPAAGNTDPAQEESGAASSVVVRSELAKMFGLPDDFAQHPRSPEDDEQLVVEPDDRTGDEVESPGQSADPSQADPAQAEEAHEEDDWRSRLSAVLGEFPTKDSSQREPESQPSISEPQEPLDEVTSSVSESEESIASYMHRLLARTRGSSEEVTSPPADSRSHVKSSSVASDGETETIPVDDDADSPLISEPRRRLDKESTRAELQSFRQVANMSARAALARHTWRTTSTELSIQSAIATGCALGSLGYLGAPLWGHAPQWFPGMGCTVGALFLGFRAWQTYAKLRQWSQAYDLASLMSHSEQASEAEVDFEASSDSDALHPPAEDQPFTAAGEEVESGVASLMEPAAALEAEHAVVDEHSISDEVPEAATESNERLEKPLTE